MLTDPTGPCLLPKENIANGHYEVEGLTYFASEYIEDADNTTVQALCDDPYSPNVTSVQCLSTLFWMEFECIEASNCTLPALTNGFYSNSDGDVLATGAVVITEQELTPSCDDKYHLNTNDTLVCRSTGNFTGDVSCSKNRDSCSELGATSNSVACSVNEDTDLYTCTMTCSDGYITSSEGENSQTITCNYTTDVWSHETDDGNTDWDECLADNSCTVPELTNGFYSNSDGDVLTTGADVVTDQALTPSCDDKYDLSGSDTLVCSSAGNFTGDATSCTKDKDSCSELSATSNAVSCSTADLYTCTMTCNTGYYIISSDGDTLENLQTITCNYTTEVWSHETDDGNTDWDECLEETDPVAILLSSTMSLSGGTCPDVTSIDTALNVWLGEQDSSAYGCYQNGSCSLGSGSSCSDDGSDTISYAFKINQTEETSADYMTVFGTELTQDAAAGNISLAVSSDKRKRATTTFTSESATSETSVTCASGSQSVDGSCVKCSKGYYEEDDVCTVCPLGTYSDSTGSAECTDCVDGKTTLSTGADSASDCKVTCTVPDLENGSSDPDEGDTTLTSTTITITCDNEYDTGYNNDDEFTCQDSYQCYAQCELPTLASNQAYSDSLTAGSFISYGRTVTVTCVGSENSLTCLGNTLTIPDCSPSIEVTGVEDIKSGTAATVSCKVSTISSAVSITWHDADGSEITSSSSYLIEHGEFGDYTQSSTMEISSDNTGSDASYKCKASSVNLNADLDVDVFDIAGKGASVASGSSATLSCTVTGATKQLPITWKLSSGSTVTSGTSDGTYTSGTQVATLTVTAATEEKSYKCFVEASDGNMYDVTIELEVDETDGGGGGGGGGMVIIIPVVVVLLLVVGAAAGGFIFYRKRKRSKQRHEEIYMNSMSDSSATGRF